MRAAKKSKACHSCAKGKRRCDKAQPICGRCDELDLECRYPQRRRRRPQDPTANHHRDDGAQGLSTLNRLESPEPLDLDQLLGRPAQDHWFLGPDSWTISHLPSNVPPFSSAVFSNFTRGLNIWLKQWVDNGQNPFIHHQLYAESGLPKCMRDAYTSIAVHSTQTESNEALVFQVLEANAGSLVTSHTLDTNPGLDTRQHLARTQALFVHLAIALFSSPIRTRGQAERHIPLFMNWLDQLWESATRDLETASHPLLGNSANQEPRGPEIDIFFDGDPAPRLWRMWVVAESVRRIWLIGTMTVGIYLTLQRGSSKCNGGARFTARGDIWAAESAVAWSKLVKEQDPLFLPSLDCSELFTRTRAPEVDEFAKHLLTVMYGLERVESWIARTTVSEDALGIFF
ncbi:hypothetical protein B0T10DRAFT_412129 [Thelonectria olida]|uniref:Zn(2)-C6 fungal-type domain-containing protein n=1 Tax=Thelonectria olida TaxID=1576542 RepID=A0A9P9ANA1_9HYPO|nr:hypothetical protein B0T10DRAFT_412129 [Thelonectria olida]